MTSHGVGCIRNNIYFLIDIILFGWSVNFYQNGLEQLEGGQNVENHIVKNNLIETFYFKVHFIELCAWWGVEVGV